MIQNQGVLKTEIVNQDEHTYYNVYLYNNLDKPIAASFTDQRPQPIIDDPSDHHMTVVRFKVPTINLPIFAWPTTISVNPTDSGRLIPDNTFYVVRLRSLSGAISQSPVIYSGFNQIVPYGVYSYQEFLSWVNAAIFNAYLFWSPKPDDVSFPPYFYLDENASEIKLVAPLGFEKNGGGGRLEINLYLSQFFTSFNLIPNGSSNWKTDFATINISFNGNNRTTSDPPISGFTPGTPALKMSEEYPQIGTWSSIKSLTFSSAGLPIKDEFIQNPPNSSTKNFVQKIITDFEPLANQPGSNRTYLQYNADNYRYLDMFGKLPLYKFDLSLFWTDEENNIFPLFLDPGQYISCKVLFTRKKALR